MSASNKKKLRKEQAADVLTTKQSQAQAEAKRLRIYTIAFLTTLGLVLCAFLCVMGIRAVNNSGIIQKNTVAAQIGDQQLNSVELSYYYVDSVNSYYNQWYQSYGDSTGSYLQAMGLDVSKPLDQQIQDQESGKTWAQYFIDEAIKQAASDKAMCDLANAESFTLTEEQKATVESNTNMLATYATLGGYSSADVYLRSIYGYGANMNSYTAYTERSALAAAYYTAYADKLVYTQDQRDEYAADKQANFNAFTYDSVYMSYTYFRQGGTKDENGSTTYSDAENANARDAMKKAAEQLATSASVAELKEKIKLVGVNEGSSLSVTENKDVLYSSLNDALAKWLSDANRKDGDIAAIPNESTTTDADGKEVKETNGYYVVIYHSTNDNTLSMADIGYIFEAYEGGTKDDKTGETTYTDAEKAAAKTAVEGFLKTWNESTDKTAAAFETLANKLIEEEKASSGGLVENVNPGSNFASEILSWSLAEDDDTTDDKTESRIAGDTTIVEADNGFYLLYYTGASKLNYRQYMIDNEMRAADYEKWYKEKTEAVKTSILDTSKINLGITISGS